MFLHALINAYINAYANKSCKTYDASGADTAFKYAHRHRHKGPDARTNTQKYIHTGTDKVTDTSANTQAKSQTYR